MLTESEKTQMKRIFRAIDRDLNGELSKDEIILGLEKLGIGKEKAKV